MSTTLTRWTNRVADIKFRELEVSSRYDKNVVRSVQYIHRVSLIQLNFAPQRCFQEMEERLHPARRGTESHGKLPGRQTRRSIADAHEIQLVLTHLPIENMRKMFYRWLTAARKVRHRRLLLQQREDELKLTAITAAWDKWRERYLDIRLHPIVSDFLET